jgi:hypothetical protein
MNMQEDSQQKIKSVKRDRQWYEPTSQNKVQEKIQEKRQEYW